MRVFLFLFFLLLPTQLSYHLFPPFSYLSGVRSDYLAPTIFLTDILLFVFFLISFRSFFQFLSKWRTPLLFIFVSLSISAVFSVNLWVSMYKIGKITELLFFSWFIAKQKLSLRFVFFSLLCAALWINMLAVAQFMLGRTVGGIFWWMGERTFYLSTPGIAAVSLFGRMFLRPYATFSHPNVLGGFFALLLPLCFSSSRSFFWRYVGCVSICFGLILSFSHAAWIAGLIGICGWLIGRRNMPNMHRYLTHPLALFSFYVGIMFSVFIPFFLFHITHPFLQMRSLRERIELTYMAVFLVQEHMWTGVGIGAFVSAGASRFTALFGSIALQPVHNIYLLLLSETGVIGLSMFLFGLTYVWRKITQASLPLVLIFFQILFLGTVDHYFLTLQQGQLLLATFLGLLCAPDLSFPQKMRTLSRKIHD